MAWTKRDIVQEAYAELALAGYEFDLSPEEQQTGVRRLDLMMAQWAGPGKGLHLGYSVGVSPSGSDLDTDSGLPIYAIRTVVCGLALELGAGLGKTPHPSTITAYRDGMQQLLAQAAFPAEQQLPNTLPRGAGSKPWRTTNQPFMPTPDTGPLQVGEDGGLQFGD
jgi:hypothetical protein